MWRLPICNHQKPSIAEKRQNKTKYPTWSFTMLEFVKKAIVSYPVKSLRYIKCHSSSRPRQVYKYTRPIQIPQVILFSSLNNKIPLDTYWWVQPVCMKIQAPTFPEPPRNTIRTRRLWKIKVGYDLNPLLSYTNIIHFPISSRRKSK